MPRRQRGRLHSSCKLLVTRAPRRAKTQNLACTFSREFRRGNQLLRVGADARFRRSTGAPVIRTVAGVGIAIELARGGPKSRRSPSRSGGVTQRQRCRRCETAAGNHEPRTEPEFCRGRLANLIRSAFRCGVQAICVVPMIGAKALLDGTPMGHGPRGLQRERRCVELFHPRPSPLARHPTGGRCIECPEGCAPHAGDHR
jgi:hypothetical protein